MAGGPTPYEEARQSEARWRARAEQAEEENRNWRHGAEGLRELVREAEARAVRAEQERDDARDDVAHVRGVMSMQVEAAERRQAALEASERVRVRLEQALREIAHDDEFRDRSELMLVARRALTEGNEDRA